MNLKERIQDVSYKLNKCLDCYISAHFDSFNKYKYLRTDTIKNGVVSTVIDCGLGFGIGYKIAGIDGAGIGTIIGLLAITGPNFINNFIKHELPNDLVEEAVLGKLKKDLKLSDDEIEGFIRYRL